MTQTGVKMQVINKVRFAALDNTKFYLTILVILHHTAITYGAEGSWYYEPEFPDSIDTGLLTLFVGLNQSFFMGLFFFISGLFVNASIAANGYLGVVKRKLIHLMIPFFLYVLFIHPLCMLLARTSPSSIDDFNLTHYLTHLSQISLGNSGPLWFVGVLFFFVCSHLLVHRLVFSGQSLWGEKINHLRHRWDKDKGLVFLLISLIAVLSFTTRQFFPDGFTWFNIQLSYLPQYLVLYSLGVFLGVNGEGKLAANIKISIWAISSVLLFFIMLASLVAADGNVDLFRGGLSYWCAIYSFVQAFHSISFSILFLWLVATLCKQGWCFESNISGNAYFIYWLHAPVLIAVSVFFEAWGARPLLKFLMVGILVSAILLVMSAILRKFSVVRRVFG